MSTIYGYVDVFPSFYVHAGKKCIVFSNFQNHDNYSSLLGRIVDCVIHPLSGGSDLSVRSMILDFGVWHYGHPPHCGILLFDTDLPKSSVVCIDVTVPYLDLV